MRTRADSDDNHVKFVRRFFSGHSIRWKPSNSAQGRLQFFTNAYRHRCYCQRANSPARTSEAVSFTSERVDKCSRRSYQTLHARRALHFALAVTSMGDNEMPDSNKGYSGVQPPLDYRAGPSSYPLNARPAPTCLVLIMLRNRHTSTRRKEKRRKRTGDMAFTL